MKKGNKILALTLSAALAAGCLAGSEPGKLKGGFRFPKTERVFAQGRNGSCRQFQ